MAEEEKKDDSTEKVEETEEDEKDESAEDDKDSDEKESENPEVKKAIARRDRALRRAQKAEERVKELEAAAKGDKDKPDPVETANRRLIGASARTVLAGMGVTDKGDQKAVLSVLDLSGIEVDDEDGPDEEAIEEAIENLQRIFGGKAESRRRTPGSVKTNRGGDKSGDKADPDKARYARIMGWNR